MNLILSLNEKPFPYDKIQNEFSGIQYAYLSFEASTCSPRVLFWSNLLQQPQLNMPLRFTFLVCNFVIRMTMSKAEFIGPQRMRKTRKNVSSYDKFCGVLVQMEYSCKEIWRFNLSLFFFLSLSHASQEKYKKKEYGLLISIMVILYVILCLSCRWIAWTCYWEEHYQELPHGWKTGDCKWIAKYYSWI